MSKLTIGQDGKIYWRDDALSADTIVRAFDDRHDQIQKLERERDEWRAKVEAAAGPVRWPSPEEAARFRQSWLAGNCRNWANWDGVGSLNKSEHTEAMAALFDWIRGGCPEKQWGFNRRAFDMDMREDA